MPSQDTTQMHASPAPIELSFLANLRIDTAGSISQPALHDAQRDPEPATTGVSIDTYDPPVTEFEQTRRRSQSSSSAARQPPTGVQDPAQDLDGSARVGIPPAQPQSGAEISTSPQHQAGDLSKSDRWLDSWYPEVLCCGIASALLIAACILLAIADDKPLSWWPWNWQISSALALLTALIEAALLYTLTACLGQLSWLWYRRDAEDLMRELVGFELIYRAFTPLGAVALMFHKTVRW